MFDAPPDPAHASGALMQSSAFAAALHLCDRQPIRLPSGHLLLSARVCGIPVLMLPRAAPPTDLDTQLASAGLSRRPLVLSPETPCDLPPALRLFGPRARFELDLTLPETQRRAALHQNWRHQLGQAERGILRVRHAAVRPDDPILPRARDQAATRGYRDWPAGLTAAFAQVAPDRTRLFTAFDRGMPVAAMLFLLHADRATYHIGLTQEAGRRLHAHNLILWHAARWMASQGIRSLDLGLATPGAPGIDRFKRRTGARICQTGGTWLRWRPLARQRPA